MEPRAAPPILRPNTALFLDFDGTLAPIQQDPAAVFPPARGADILRRLSGAFGSAVCLISGRDVRDLAARTPDFVWRAGGHGLELCAPGAAPAAAPPAPPAGLREAVNAAAMGRAGVRVEDKGPVCAVHYRAAPDAGEALADALAPVVARFDGYALQRGKMVLEAKPADAHKGRALNRLMDAAPFRGRTPVMVGDDVTDEDAMAAAAALGGWAVKVGDGESVAAYGLSDPDAVWDWLALGGEHVA